VLLAALVAPTSATAAQATPDTEPRPDHDFDILIESDDLSQRILVAPFTATTRDSRGLAVDLYEFLFGELLASDRHEMLELADCRPVDDISASLYYAGCPPGDELGCQFVIGEVSRVDRVISGRVTALEDGDFRVAVTIVDVAKARLALTYVLDLRADEDDLLPRTVLMTLDNLMQQELDAPYEDARKRQEARLRVLEEARTEEERQLVARMNIELREGELERLEADLNSRPSEHLSQADLEDMKRTEGAEAAWRELGITSKQYRSLKNSGLDFEKWRWRWAGHRLQLLGSVQIGLIGGATGLRYSGGYYTSPPPIRVVDNFAWQQVSEGSSMSLGVGVGFGILRNLDIEVAGMWSRSKVHIRLLYGQTIEDPEDPSRLVVDPANRPSGDWSEQTVNLVGGEVMLRYYILTVPKLRPSFGVGFTWLTYPDLYTDPDVPYEDQNPRPPIEGRDYKTFRQVFDFGPQIEPGVQLDLNRWMGIFLRVPVMFAANPKRVETYRTTEPGIEPLFNDDDATPDSAAPFGIVRVVVGVQGRLFGMPVKPKQDYDDMLEEDAAPEDTVPEEVEPEIQIQIEAEPETQIQIEADPEPEPEIQIEPEDSAPGDTDSDEEQGDAPN